MIILQSSKQRDTSDKQQRRKEIEEHWHNPPKSTCAPAVVPAAPATPFQTDTSGTGKRTLPYLLRHDQSRQIMQNDHILIWSCVLRPSTARGGQRLREHRQRGLLGGIVDTVQHAQHTSYGTIFVGVISCKSSKTDRWGQRRMERSVGADNGVLLA